MMAITAAIGAIAFTTFEGVSPEAAFGAVLLTGVDSPAGVEAGVTVADAGSLPDPLTALRTS